MKLLIDAQLPRRLCLWLREQGHDAVHTLDLAEGNHTPDELINQLSVGEERVVVTKDGDFVDSLILRGVPYKLLLVSTGNIRNRALERIFMEHVDAIAAAFVAHSFVEIDHVALRIHF